MSKQLNVNLSFTADTAQAKAQIKSLQESLGRLITDPTMGGELKITDELRKASLEAAQLKSHLSAATNMKTGTIDFTKLSRSLKDSNTSLQAYAASLVKMGPQGQQAFNQLTRAVAQSEIPIRRTNKLIQEMGVTLKNSLRWQLSSSMLHGFMSGMQDAYNYAKNLNSALTDIRIVSGQSADQMARFAKQANISAKELNTTTREYAKAALIYYQQGLKESEVKERTDVTVKMSNVTGDAAQEVSSYMTAIWNNFNKAGDESVEHYADVMTKLGAATAASTSEIAAGLSKFSAVADTIGLSFDMATSAVTAIVDQTRETPEVVGTALKTIFSRIEGLQQGDTMEDGVDLNKYSQGLKTVGVDIMNANGELKDADQILNEIGAKWDTLSKNQQVALAQTTAGVRQYNQFMALFDNWDKVQQNLTMAATADGTLDAQAEIYGESWEAASNRVRTALEGIYDSVLEDDMFIGMLNGLAEVLGFIEGVVDALGGMKGLLVAIGAVLTNVFGKQMANGLRNMAENIKMMTPGGRAAIQKEKQEYLEQAAKMQLGDTSQYGKNEGTARQESIRKSIELQNQFIENAGKMSDAEKQTTQNLMDGLDQQTQKTAEAAKAADEAAQQRRDAKDILFKDMVGQLENDYGENGYSQEEAVKRFTAGSEAEKKLRADLTTISDMDDIINDIGKNGEYSQKHIDDLTTKLKELGMTDKDLEKVSKRIPGIETDAEHAKRLLTDMRDDLHFDATAEFDEATKNYTSGKAKTMDAVVKGVEDDIAAEKRLKQQQDREALMRQNVEDSIQNAQGVKVTAADGIVSIANAAANAMMVVTMLSGAIQTLKNPDASGWDKFLAIIGLLSVAIPVLTSSFTMLASEQSIAGVEALANTVAQKTNTIETLKNAAAQKLQASSTRDSAAAMGEDSAATSKNSQQSTLNTLTQLQGKQKGTNKVFGAGTSALGRYGKAIGTIISKLGVYGLAIGAVAVAVWACVKAWNADKDAAEKASKAAMDASEAYETATQAQQDMTSTLDSYNTAVSSLESLTRGTYEWVKALNDANQAVLTLMASFPDLVQHISNNNGKLEISPEGIKYLQEESQKRVENAYNTNLMATKNAEEANLEYERTQLKRDLGMAGQSDSQSIDKILKAVEEQGSGFLASEESIQEVLKVNATQAKEIFDHSNDIIELSNDMALANKKSEMYSSQMGAMGLEGVREYEKSSAEQQRLAEQAYGEELEKRTNEIYNSKYKNMSDATLRSEYAKSIGATDFEKVDRNTAKYLDSEGNVIGEFDDATAGLALAELDATAGMGDFVSSLYTATDGLIAFHNALLGDNQGIMSEEVASAIVSRDEETGQFDFSSMSQDELYDFIARTGGKKDNDYDLSSVDYKSMGYGSLEEYQEDMHNQALELYKSNEELASSSAEYRNDVIENMFNDDESTSTNEYSPASFTDDPSQFTQTQNQQQTTTSGGDILLSQLPNTGETQVSTGTETQEQTSSTSDNDIRARGQAEEDHTSGVQEEVLKGLQELNNPSDDPFAENLFGDMSDSEFGSYIESKLPEIEEQIEGGATSEEIVQGIADDRRYEIKDQELNAEATSEGFDVAELEKSAEHYQNIAESSDEIADNIAEDPLGAKQIALDTKTIEKGVNSLNECFSEYEETLEEGDRLSEEWSDAMNAMVGPTADLLNVEESLVDKNFVEEHYDDIRAAAEGSKDAYNRLQASMGETTLLAQSGWGELPGMVSNAITNIANIEGVDIGEKVTVGTDAVANDLALLYAEAYNSAIEGGKSVAEAKAIANQAMQSVGFDAGNIEMEAREMTFTGDIPDGWIPHENGEVTIRDVEGNETVVKGVTCDKTEGGTYTYKQTLLYPKDGAKFTKRTERVGGGGNKGKGGGGGGSKSTQIKKIKKSDVTKRYKPVTDDLQDLTRAQEKASKTAENLYGKKRIESMKQVNKLLREQVKMLTDRKLAEAQGYLTQDMAELQRVADSLRNDYEVDLPTLIFDKEGNLDNYEAVMGVIWDKINAIQSQYKDEDEIDETTQEELDKWKDRADRLQAAIDQYDETLNLVEEVQDEVDDLIEEMQTNNLEMFTYQIEFQIEMNESDFEKLEYFFNKTQKDNIYDMAEGAAILGEQYTNLAEKAKIYRDSLLELNSLWLNPDKMSSISERDYYEQFNELISNLIASAEELEELLETMGGSYYRDSLELGIEEIEKYADRFENLTGIIDHYQSIAATLGKETDYKLMGSFLQGTADVLDNKLDSSKEKMRLLREEQAYWESQLANYTAGSEEYNLIKKNLESVQELVAEAEDDMLSTLEEKAEAMKAVIENRMAEIAKILEDTFTNGLGFDSFMSSFEKLNGRQEEYLTKTNQIYETNKLMRQAAQAADKTDNEVAKRKLKNFENETKSLQENTKLSNLELEIQQAKYDLLLAEIALEEAQNAKSTVRLQRDNEGNFGYVYTANKDEIANAQQAYEDAQNALYNISLQGQQDYTSKYLEAIQRMQEELAELNEQRLNGEIESEQEYNDKRAAIYDHYFNPDTGVLVNYQKLYNISLQASAEATADYWGKSYADMINNTDKWKEDVLDSFNETSEAFGKWEQDQEEINKDLADSFGDNEEAIQGVTNASDILAESIINGVIPAIENEIEYIRDLTAQYIELTKTIRAAVEENEKFIGTSADDIKKYNVSDWLREAIAISQGKGTTDLTIDEALAQRKNKILSDQSLWEGLGYGGMTSQQVSDAIQLEHDSIKSVLARGAADTGWHKKTSEYLNGLVEDTSQAYDKDEILNKYTDFSFEMLMLSGDSKYLKYASFEKFADAVAARRNKTGNVWTDLSGESIFIRADYEDKVANYLEKLRSDFDKDNSKYPNIDLASAGIATDLSTAIKQYASGDTSGYIKNDSDMEQALRSRNAIYTKFKDLVNILSNEELGIDTSKWIDKYDTGGYTGEWGPEGKLAWLHQKELVLNASDTEKMLQMVEIVRDLSNQIDIFAARQALNGGYLTSPSYGKMDNGVLEQNVHIDASFPGVTDRNQIEEAFGNLVNIAYQYANRR